MQCTHLLACTSPYDVFRCLQPELLPISGLKSFNYSEMAPHEKVGDLITHLVLPVGISAIGGLAGISRYMKSSLLEGVEASLPPPVQRFARENRHPKTCLAQCPFADPLQSLGSLFPDSSVEVLFLNPSSPFQGWDNFYLSVMAPGLYNNNGNSLVIGRSSLSLETCLPTSCMQ